MRPIALAAKLALVAGLSLAAACTTFKPGGSGWSDDAFTYYSVAHEPKNVTLLDTRTGLTLWTCEVPVGKQLSIQFFKGDRSNNSNTPDEMKWDILPIGTTGATLQNTMQVPNEYARRVDMTIRTHPEIAKDSDSAPSGAPAGSVASQPNHQ